MCVLVSEKEEAEEDFHAAKDQCRSCFGICLWKELIDVAFVRVISLLYRCVFSSLLSSRNHATLLRDSTEICYSYVQFIPFSMLGFYLYYSPYMYKFHVGVPP